MLRSRGRRQIARIAILLLLGVGFAGLFAFGSRALADVTYTYDADGRLTGVCNGSGQCVTYAYDPDANITAVSLTSSPTPTATATP
jgi:YD repeat-containing protein